MKHNNINTVNSLFRLKTRMLLTSLNFGCIPPKFHSSTTIPKIADILFPMHGVTNSWTRLSD